MGTSNHPPETPSENNASSPPPKKGKGIWTATVVLLVLLVAVTGVVWYFAKHGLPAKGATIAGAGAQTNMTAFIANLSPDEKQQAYKNEVQTMQDRLTRLQTYLDGFPKALTDVDALGLTLTTPEAAFEFVRDRVAFEPYPGVMKGARATLLTRGGNSLDRALLLAAILKQNGVPVKIAHGKLPPDQAQKLLQQIAAQPGSLEQILQSLAGQAPAATVTDHQQELEKRLEQRAQQAGSAVNDALEKNVPLLLSALKKAGVPDASATASRQLEILQDHYWVTATVADQPADLDPSAKDASVNSKLTDAVETFDPDDLADALFQHVRFRLVGEFLENGRLQSSELLLKEVKATDLFGKNVRLAVAPFTLKTNENRFQPVLLVGDERTDGQAFRLSGQSSGEEEKSAEGTSGADTGAAKAAGGLLGGLGGDEEAAPAPKPEPKVKPAATAGGPVLARLFLEVTSAGPHLSDAHYQRVILDRLEASGSKLQIQPALADDKVVRALLVQAWDGGISVGSNNLVYVLGAQLENLKTQESMEEKARSRAFLGEGFGVDDLSRPTLPPELIEYFFSSDGARFLLSRRHAPKAKSYYERPRLAFFRHGFVVGDWSKPQGAHRFAEGIDLLNAPFQFVGDGNDAQRLAVEAGIADTALERMTVQPDRSFNTVPLFSAASAEGVSILTITPAQKPALDNLTIPPAIKNVLAGELAQGQTLILPARLVKLTDTQTYGWWSVDPATGMALGKMELGGAQAMTETSKINERIEKWTEIFAKFYGGLLKCYMTALGENLGAIEPAPFGLVQPGHLKQGELGQSPMPDSDKLASCVIKQACDAVAEILTEAAFSPGFAKEAEAEIRPLEEIIMRWAMEKMNEKATGDIKDGMAKACEERAGAGE